MPSNHDTWHWQTGKAWYGVGVKKIGREYTITKETSLVLSELNSDKMDGEEG